jgi:alpha-L-arabinofuranosidase
LLTNVHHKQWNPDLIYFDSSRVCGQPSYYVQKMFSENRGDVVLRVAVEEISPTKAEPIHGLIGVGTWSTQAEFKDIKVVHDGKVLFQSDFDKGTAGWKSLQGDWKTEGGVLRQTSDATNCRILVGDPEWNNYTVTLKARKLGGQEGFLILFGVDDESTASWWNLGGWGNLRHGVERSCVSPNSATGQIETNRWYDIRIELADQRIRCYLDGVLIHEATQLPPPSPLHIVASRIDTTGEIIVKVVNVANTVQETEIDVRGVQGVEADAKAIVLTSASWIDENSLDDPTKVKPFTTAIKAARVFRHTFPARSVSILRLATQK